MRLVNIKEIKGTLHLLSGLHIGAGDAEMRIGGTDNPVIKHPHTNEPYIPGSSLKGKVRSLLELRSGLMGESRGKPLSASLARSVAPDKRPEAERIVKLFGSGGADADAIAALGPTRVSFADCSLSEKCRSKAREQMLPLTEVKSENSIDRIKGVAENPRQTERVPAGLEFDFAISLKVLAENEEDLLTTLLEGLKLLEWDALGGSGSRGYGRVRFTFEDQDLNERFQQVQPFGENGKAGGSA